MTNKLKSHFLIFVYHWKWSLKYPALIIFYQIFRSIACIISKTAGMDIVWLSNNKTKHIPYLLGIYRYCNISKKPSTCNKQHVLRSNYTGSSHALYMHSLQQKIVHSSINSVKILKRWIDCMLYMLMGRPRGAKFWINVFTKSRGSIRFLSRKCGYNHVCDLEEQVDIAIISEIPWYVKNICFYVEYCLNLCAR